MKCKYCGEEMAEELITCPSCGKAQTSAEDISAEIQEVLAIKKAIEEAAEAARREAAAEAEEEAEETEETDDEETDDESDDESDEDDEDDDEDDEDEDDDDEDDEDEDDEEDDKKKKKSSLLNNKKFRTALIALALVGAFLIGLVAPGVVAKIKSIERVKIPHNGDPTSSLCKANYTVKDNKAMANSNVVVATMGDKTLTNGVLQAFYWQEVNRFLDQYGSYAVYFGLDVQKPLNKQLYGGGGLGANDLSWQQFFLDSAVNTWKNYQALALEAEETGFVMPEDLQAEYDAMPAQLEEAALLRGHANADAMLKKNVGAACSLESYMQYVYIYYYGMAYYQHYCENLAPTDAEIEAFYNEKQADFEADGVTKDAKFVNVRHVLIQPEYEAIGEDGYPVFTDEAWEDCRLKVEEIYNTWQEGDMSEESFAQLAVDNSVDGNAAQGGLYEDVRVGQMVEEFEAWCFDESRQPGDHGLVKTQYGYHIMFFSAHRNWFDHARDGLINDIAYDKIPLTTEKYPATVNYKLVKLGDLRFS